LSDPLLVGWEEIHEDLFCDRTGKPVIRLDTLQKRYGPDMKKKGVIFYWTMGRGKQRKQRMVGWKSVIQNYFIRKHQRMMESG